MFNFLALALLAVTGGAAQPTEQPKICTEVSVQPFGYGPAVPVQACFDPAVLFGTQVFKEVQEQVRELEENTDASYYELTETQERLQRAEARLQAAEGAAGTCQEEMVQVKGRLQAAEGAAGTCQNRLTALEGTVAYGDRVMWQGFDWISTCPTCSHGRDERPPEKVGSALRRLVK